MIITRTKWREIDTLYEMIHDIKKDLKDLQDEIEYLKKERIDIREDMAAIIEKEMQKRAYHIRVGLDNTVISCMPKEKQNETKK